MAISKRQPMRPALIDAIDAINEGRGGTGTISAAAPVHETPMLQFGTSNAISVGALQRTTIDVTFSQATTEEPLVFVNLQHTGTYGDLTWHVSNVTNQQASVVIVNNGSQDVDGVTVDWLAVSGR